MARWEMGMDSPLPFAHVFRLIRRLFRARQSPRPARQVSVVLERLEERCVTTVLAGMEGVVSFGPKPPAWAAGKTAATPDSGASPANWTTRTDSALASPFPAGSANDPVGRALQAPAGDRALTHFFSLFGHDSLRPGSASFRIEPWQNRAETNPTPMEDPPGESGRVGVAEALPEAPADWAPDADPGRSQATITAPLADGSPPYRTTAAPVSTTASAPARPAAPSDNGGLEAASAPSQVVTASLVSVPSSAGVSESSVSTFRISRTPVSDTPVEVHYTLTAYSSSGAAAQEGVATISAGSGHVDVPAETAPAVPAGGTEVVTLTLADADGYQVARPAATLFPAGDARDCSEAALLEAYRQGKSGEAFGALVERYRPAVLRTCYRVLGNWADAEDVSQLVFLALARRQFRMGAVMAGWLGTVARNAAIMFLRARNRRKRHEQQAAKPVQATSEESSHELREELDAALTRLPGPLQEAVRLRYLDGLSQLEAAAVVGCPRGTLAQRAAHGVRYLRGILGNGADRG